MFQIPRLCIFLGLVVVEGLGLERVRDRARLVADVARVVAKTRDAYLGNHDLFRVMPSPDESPPRVEDGGRRRPLVYLVQDGSCGRMQCC